ncbi:DUF3558 domain-containing protein [Amycolatopsis sp. A133]|uniref:DUF3558 domain-containing protein n=1 Tax=Amycolatopsis sp. A133 TaxID=3064472 RepID=UPI0027EF4EAE|nr:DUF3558 domain-containing protein [Amycolatopsis sp. A133]MDQ7810443.1 DUF3558 domain-containing protein [Amycolatopsis sp. A133]
MRGMAFLLGTSLLVLTACTGRTDGTALPSSRESQSTTASPPDDTLPGAGVPKVDNPIDISHFQQLPCDSLTPEQSKELLGPDVTTNPAVDDEAGPTCRWNVPAVSQAGVGVTYFKTTRLGLTGIYRAKDTVYPFFEPLEPIDGYPTVAFGQIDERSTRGRCLLALGTSDTQQVDISISLSEAKVGKKDPCAAAHDVAAKVLDNLRKAR